MTIRPSISSLLFVCGFFSVPLSPLISRPSSAEESTATPANSPVDLFEKDALEKRIHRLEESLSLERGSQKTTVPPEQIPLRISYEDGLRFESADRSLRLSLGGRIDTDSATSFGENEAEDLAGDDFDDKVEFRRARIAVGGSIDPVRFRFMVDFTEGASTLVNAYLETRLGDLSTLRLGFTREPFGLEALTSAKYITFLERSLVTELTPGRNTGFLVSRSSAERRTTASLGAFYHAGDQGRALVEDGFGVTARLTAIPHWDPDRRTLVHLGVAATYRDNREREFRIRARPEAQLLPFLLDTGLLDRPDWSRGFAGELAWLAGPFALQAEAITNEIEAASGRHRFHGFTAQGSFFLTGEQKEFRFRDARFGRLTPHRPLHGLNSSPRIGPASGGGWGAWEIAARHSFLDLEDGLVRGGKLHNTTLGLNWYLNQHTKLMLNTIRADLDNAAAFTILQIRFHVDF